MTLADLQQFVDATKGLPPNTEVRFAPATWKRGTGTSSIPTFDPDCRSIGDSVSIAFDPADPPIFKNQRDAEKMGYVSQDWDNATAVVLLQG